MREGYRAGEELSKDVVSAGDQLEQVWFHWNLGSMNFSTVCPALAWVAAP